MRKFVFTFALMLFALTSNAKSTLKGDVNGDGELSITDIAMMVNHILGYTESGFIAANADINGDGAIDIEDLNKTIVLIVSTDTPSYLECPDNNHPHMIDLGLPSGRKWACCSVDASAPEDFGGYYAWGETSTKSDYSWSAYTLCGGSMDNCQDLGSSICGTKYDVARKKWGGSWRMPDMDDLNELLDNTTFVETTKNNVKGMFIKGSNGGSIFLPYNGFYEGNSVSFKGEYGYFWTGTQQEETAHSAYGIYVLPFSGPCYGYHYRCCGYAVRPVAD